MPERSLTCCHNPFKGIFFRSKKHYPFWWLVCVASRWAFRLKHIMENKAIMKRRIVLVLLVFPFLISCGEKVSNPALSPSAWIKASVTPTLISTQTLLPTPSVTVTVSRTPFSFPTTPAEATEHAVANQYCGNNLKFPRPNGFLPSKSGKLMAFVCWPSDGKDISITRVIALDGSRHPVQASYRKDYLGVDYSQPLPQYIQYIQAMLESESLPPWIGYYALYPVRWTVDDKFLYLVRESPADGITYPPNIFGMVRLNVETGKVKTLLSPERSYYCDFSEDGTKLLSIDGTRKPLSVKIQNLETGDEMNVRLDKKFDDAGSLRLSPNGSKLLISALDRDDGGGFSIILADLRLGSQTYLDHHYDYASMSWVNDHTIYGSGWEDGNAFFFYLDTTTMQTSPAPTSTPGQ